MSNTTYDDHWRPDKGSFSDTVKEHGGAEIQYIDVKQGQD